MLPGAGREERKTMVMTMPNETERRQQLLTAIDREQRAHEERIRPLRQELTELSPPTVPSLEQQPDRDLTKVPRHLWRI